MKNWIKVCYVLFLLTLLVSDGIHGIDETRIIGTKFDIDAIPYGERGLWSRTVINGVMYRAFGTFYRNKILVYVYGDCNTILYFYVSYFICYGDASNTQLGIHYKEVIGIFGNPVTRNYIENPNVGYYFELLYMPLFTSFYTWKEVLRAKPFCKIFDNDNTPHGFSFRLTRRGIYMRRHAFGGMGVVFLFDEDYKLEHIALVRTGVE